MNIRILLALILILKIGDVFGQTENASFKNAIGIGLPLPGLVTVEYEHYLNDYSSNKVWSAGISLGYGYDAGKFEPDFARGFEDLFETSVSFEVKWDFVINPFVRFYFGNPEKKFRPSVMFKPSIVTFNIENEKNYTLTAYEFHFLGTYSFNKRFYGIIGFGFKHFLTKKEIVYNGEKTTFPAFKFQPDKLDEKPKQWLPSTDLIIGYRF